MQTLEFKAKLTITFYAAVNHYRNGHPKAETSKKDQNPPITNQERDLLTSSLNIALVSLEVRDMIDGSVKQFYMMCLELHSSHVIEKRNKWS